MVAKKPPHVIRLEMGGKYVVVLNTTEPVEPEDANRISVVLSEWFESSLPFIIMPMPPKWEVRFEKVEP